MERKALTKASIRDIKRVQTSFLRDFYEAVAGVSHRFQVAENHPGQTQEAGQRVLSVQWRIEDSLHHPKAKREFLAEAVQEVLREWLAKYPERFIQTVTQAATPQVAPIVESAAPQEVAPQEVAPQAVTPACSDQSLTTFRTIDGQKLPMTGIYDWLGRLNVAYNYVLAQVPELRSQEANRFVPVRVVTAFDGDRPTVVSEVPSSQMLPEVVEDCTQSSSEPPPEIGIVLQSQEECTEDSLTVVGLGKTPTQDLLDYIVNQAGSLTCRAAVRIIVEDYADAKGGNYSEAYTDLYRNFDNIHGTHLGSRNNVKNGGGKNSGGTSKRLDEVEKMGKMGALLGIAIKLYGIRPTRKSQLRRMLLPTSTSSNVSSS
jgi:hypothetical protein